jgi:hypothetical protein
MKDIWSQHGRVLLERDFWIAVMKAQRDLGVAIPAEAIKDYERVKTDIDLERHRERERVTLHDVKARIEEFSDLAGRQFIHLGLTSRDLTENVEQLQVFPPLKLVQLQGRRRAPRARETGRGAPRSDDHGPHAQRAGPAHHPRQAPRDVRPGAAHSPSPASRTSSPATRSAASRAPSARSSTSSPCSAATPPRSTSSRPA